MDIECSHTDMDLEPLQQYNTHNAQHDTDAALLRSNSPEFWLEDDSRLPLQRCLSLIKPILVLHRFETGVRFVFYQGNNTNQNAKDNARGPEWPN